MVGTALVAIVLVDMLNTLITTTRATGRWWPTHVIYRLNWALVRALGRRMHDERHRERFLSWFGPASVLAMLVAWVVQQVVGFGLIWWGLGGIDQAGSLGDAVYYSGVVYFTLGFGEIVPADTVPRFGALVEAFCGVLTTALVIGYLPALYGAFSQREQKLLTLDDGTEDRITPTNLVLARAPDGDVDRLEDFFREWEQWVAHVLETHTTFPMLGFFRSQHPGQHWVTALGLITDAAMHVEICRDGQNRSAYWTMRRAVRLFETATEEYDLTEYRRAAEEQMDGNEDLFRALYDDLVARGWDLLPYDEARAHSREIRRSYAASLEFLIDYLEAPRGFWGHAIGHRREALARQTPVERAQD